MSRIDPIIKFQSPVGNELRFYNRSIPGAQQSAIIPATFCDAMTVREAVFVNEIKAVSFGHHTDRDDARSCHWVIYSPVPGGSASARSAAKSLPIGTIRLIPYPHHPLPEEGAYYEAPRADVPAEESESLFTGPVPKYVPDRRTSLHDGKEPYIKLGRLSVLKEFRGSKLADALIQAALKWAAENPEFSSESLPDEGVGLPKWNGLVCVHAHERAMSTWARNGFLADEEMGTWFEAGLKHHGMFIRVDIRHS